MWYNTPMKIVKNIALVPFRVQDYFYRKTLDALFGAEEDFFYESKTRNVR